MFRSRTSGSPRCLREEVGERLSSFDGAKSVCDHARAIDGFLRLALYGLFMASSSSGSQAGAWEPEEEEGAAHVASDPN